MIGKKRHIVSPIGGGASHGQKGNMTKRRAMNYANLRKTYFSFKEDKNAKLLVQSLY